MMMMMTMMNDSMIPFMSLSSLALSLSPVHLEQPLFCVLVHGDAAEVGLLDVRAHLVGVKGQPPQRLAA